MSSSNFDPPTSSQFDPLSNNPNLDPLGDGSGFPNPQFPSPDINIDKLYAPDAMEDEVEENYNLPGIDEYFKSIQAAIAANDKEAGRGPECPPCPPCRPSV